MRKKLLLVFLISFTVAAMLPAASINDGTFSTPSLVGIANGFQYNPTGSPWTFDGTSGLALQGDPTYAPFYTVTAPGGSGQAAFLQDYVGPTPPVPGYSGVVGVISQSITGLTIGDTYSVSFYSAQRPGYTVNPFTVSVGGTQLALVTPSTTDFTLYSDTFTATNSTELLEFASTTGPTTGNYDYDTVLADVALRSNTVTTPEPGTFALLLPALAGLALYVRRRGIYAKQA